MKRHPDVATQDLQMTLMERVIDQLTQDNKKKLLMSLMKKAKIHQITVREDLRAMDETDLGKFRKWILPDVYKYAEIFTDGMLVEFYQTFKDFVMNYKFVRQYKDLHTNVRKVILSKTKYESDYVKMSESDIMDLIYSTPNYTPANVNVKNVKSDIVTVMFSFSELFAIQRSSLDARAKYGIAKYALGYFNLDSLKKLLETSKTLYKSESIKPRLEKIDKQREIDERNYIRNRKRDEDAEETIRFVKEFFPDKLSFVLF